MPNLNGSLICITLNNWLDVKASIINSKNYQCKIHFTAYLIRTIDIYIIEWAYIYSNKHIKVHDNAD